MDQREFEVMQVGRVTEAIIERYRRCQTQQLRQVLFFRLGSVGIAADVVAVVFVPGSHFLGGSVRSVLTARSPKHYERLAFVRLDAHLGEVWWLDQIAVLEKLPLDAVKLVAVDANGRQHGLAVRCCKANDDVAATQVLKVIGECTERADRWVRVPACLVFDAVALDCAMRKQIVEVDGETT